MTTRSCPKCLLLMARCDFKFCPDCGAQLDRPSPSDATDYYNVNQNRNEKNTAEPRHEKSMKPEPKIVAAETVQTTNVPAVDVPRLVRLLRGRDDHYNAGELMTMAADALESLIRDKERMDWLETQDCWVGICGDYYAEAVNSCGGCYVKKVREVCDECLPNSQAMPRDAWA